MQRKKKNMVLLSGDDNAVFTIPNLVQVPFQEHDQYSLNDDDHDLDDDDDTDEDDSSSLESTSSSSSSSCDELYALNTALCYLCSINAHAKYVESFLVQHPQALLLEGLGYLPEESAKCIIIQRQQQPVARQQRGGSSSLYCAVCFSPSCLENRHEILDCLNKGFEYYHHHHHGQQAQEPLTTTTTTTTTTTSSSGTCSPSSFSWPLYRSQLVAMEHQVRKLRIQEFSMRQVLLERAVRVRTCQEELRKLIKRQQDMISTTTTCRHQKSSSSSCWGRATTSLLCSHRHRRRQQQHRRAADDDDNDDDCMSAAHVNDFMDRQSMLEYQADLASIHLATSQREYNDILHNIRFQRQQQFALLSIAFYGVERYSCLVGGGNGHMKQQQHHYSSINITKHYSNKMSRPVPTMTTTTTMANEQQEQKEHQQQENNNSNTTPPMPKSPPPGTTSS